MTSPRNLLLAAVAAAVCVPATAQASTVEKAADGTVLVRAAAGELNNIHIKPEGTTGVRVKDFGATLSGARQLPGRRTQRGRLPDRRGRRRHRARRRQRPLHRPARLRHSSTATAGDDLYFHDGKAGLTTTRTDFRGGAGLDRASYGPATAGVIITKDGVANDGRTINGTWGVFSWPPAGTRRAAAIRSNPLRSVIFSQVEPLLTH